MEAARARRRFSNGEALMKWVPVRDAHGKVRMEMRWQVPAKNADSRGHVAVASAA